MGFWSIFKKGSVEPDNATQIKKDEEIEIKENDFIDNSEPNSPNGANGIITISYGTGMPIDLIYGSLKEDYETRGYEDAICNPDQSYKEMNLTIIRSNMEVKFKQIILKYTDDLREVDFHIKSRSQAGLIDLVKQLEARKEMLDQHRVKLEEMEKDFTGEAPYMIGILRSYERGFTRGLAALSLELIKKQQNV